MKRFTRWLKLLTLLSLILTLCLLFAGCVAQEDALQAGLLDGQGQASGGVMESLVSMLGSRSASLQILGLLTILSLAPSLLLMFTCFTRIIIVLSFMKNALGMQQMPPSQVLIGLALILTFFIMAPVFTQIKEEAYDPYVAGQIGQDQFIERTVEPVKAFMLRQTFTDDLEAMVSMSSNPQLASAQDAPMHVLLPAFIVSEIKRGFMIGFFIYIPFIVIDMIVSSVLMSMGMMMLPPTVISLPFKVLLFIMVDGWMLTVQTLISSF